MLPIIGFMGTIVLGALLFQQATVVALVLVGVGFVGINYLAATSSEPEPQQEADQEPESESDPVPEPEPKLQASHRSSDVSRQDLLGKVGKAPHASPEHAGDSAESGGKGFYYFLCALLILAGFTLLENGSGWGLGVGIVGMLSTVFVGIYNPETPELKEDSIYVIKTTLLGLWWFGGPPLILAALSITFDEGAPAFLVPIYYGWLFWPGRGGGGRTDSGGMDSGNY